MGGRCKIGDLSKLALSDVRSPSDSNGRGTVRHSSTADLFDYSVDVEKMQDADLAKTPPGRHT